MDRDGVMVRYLGDDVIEVKGIGTFQGGTEALVPRELAFQLLESDDWAAVGKVQPAIEVVLNIGQWDGPATPPDAPPSEALQPTSPEDFGDLPSEGPEPLEGFE